MKTEDTQSAENRAPHGWMQRMGRRGRAPWMGRGEGRRGEHGHGPFGRGEHEPRQHSGPRGWERRGEHGGLEPGHRAGRCFGEGERGGHGGPPNDFGHHGRGPGGPGFGGPGGRGGRGPGGRGDGPWGRRGGPKIARGDVRGATLLLLSERPMHGYQIIQEIAERSNNVWRPSPGSVYPALQLLEDEGLIRAEQSDERRVFQLTDAGKTYVESNRAELANAWQSVTASVDDGTLQLRDLLGQVATAVHQVAQVGTPAQLASAQTLLTNVRRQLYRILADDETTNGE